MTLWQGECLELMKKIPDKSVDMILCDLPYGTTDCKWDKKININKLFYEYERIINGGVTALFSQQPFSTDLIQANRKHFRYEWIWEKSLALGFLMAKKRPLRKHENILIFSSKQPVYHPQGLIELKQPKIRKGQNRKVQIYRESSGNYITTHTNYPVDILRFPNGNHKSFHPTQKPVPLLEYLIRTYTNEGETVLDNCMGSGSTGVACVNTNRNFIGIELDENYFRIARERIEQAERNHSETLTAE